MSNSDKTYFTYACVNKHNASIANGPSSCGIRRPLEMCNQSRIYPDRSPSSLEEAKWLGFQHHLQNHGASCFSGVYMAWQNHFSAHTIARKCNGFECSAPRSKTMLGTAAIYLRSRAQCQAMRSYHDKIAHMILCMQDMCINRACCIMQFALELETPNLKRREAHVIVREYLISTSTIARFASTANAKS